MEPHRHDVRARVTPQVVFGFVIIIVGVLFTLQSLGLAYADDYIKYWPAAFIALGLAKLWNIRSGAGNAMAGILFLIFGTWMLLHNLEIIRRDAWDFWPLILVFVGSMIMWQGIRGRRERSAVDSPETINGIAVLSGVKRRSASSAFRGGELSAFMGGCEVDLRQAAINGEAVIDVFAMWGGIEIRVPTNWTVITKVTPFLGGVEDGTEQGPNPTEHRLTIRGMVVMGGVEIKN